MKLLDKKGMASVYFAVSCCMLLIACNVAVFALTPRIVAPLAIILSNAITLLLMLLAVRPVNKIIQNEFSRSAGELVRQQKEEEALTSRVRELEDRNRELESRIDTQSQLAAVPRNLNFTFKVETMTYDKTGYVVKEEALDKFMDDPAYKLADKNGFLDRVSRWLDDSAHPGVKKVLYIGKYDIRASIGIDFTKIKFAQSPDGITLFGVKFTKLNDLKIDSSEDDVNHCWLLNESELGTSINQNPLYSEFTEVYARVRGEETRQTLEGEVESLCAHYTEVFRRSLSDRYPGISFVDHIEDSSATWYSLKDHIRDERIYPLAANMFLMADVLSGSVNFLPANPWPRS